MMIETILYLALVSFSSQHDRGWKGILPLHSARADVEQLLGPPTEPCKDGCDYDTKNEGVFVRYSIGVCADGGPNAWNVSPNTVISLSVYPTARPKLSDLRLNLKKFTKTKDPELHGYSTYTNEAEGVTYSVSDDGTVTGVYWFGSSKDSRTLRCPSLRTPISTENVQEPVFDSRNSVGLTFSEDKPRLDQFARNLKKTPNAKAYVIAYGVDLGLSGEARMRLKCVRNYLAKTHNIRASRLVMIDGGYANKVNVELFLVRPGDPKPKPTPTHTLTAVRNIKPRTDPCK